MTVEEVIVYVMKHEDAQYALDDLVHDLASEYASAVNNKGPTGQLEYIEESVGPDLMAILKDTLFPDGVRCKFCNSIEEVEGAHWHQGEPVCDNCWDERLRATE